MTYKTEQETFWAGQFGNEYIQRNQSAQLLASNIALFANILSSTTGIKHVLEIGANVGMNMRALFPLLPEGELHAIEINENAATELNNLGFLTSVFNGSVFDFNPAQNFDLVFTKGVLIHLAPEMLPEVYDKMVSASSRYVMVAEYYNPTPMEINYRGHSNKMFKRDFAGEMMERHPELKLVDYGFVYRRDPNWPQDDTTWFLMEKA